MKFVVREEEAVRYIYITRKCNFRKSLFLPVRSYCILGSANAQTIADFYQVTRYEYMNEFMPHPSITFTPELVKMLDAAMFKMHLIAGHIVHTFDDLNYYLTEYQLIGIYEQYVTHCGGDAMLLFDTNVVLAQYFYYKMVQFRQLVDNYSDTFMVARLKAFNAKSEKRKNQANGPTKRNRKHKASTDQEELSPDSFVDIGG